MANHIRQQIREKFGTTLNGLTTTGSNVFESRVYPLENASLPALIIYTKSETSEPIVIGTQRLMSRELSVVVEGYAKATSNFDDTIDTISKEVEAAIAADRTLDGLAKDTYLESTAGRDQCILCDVCFGVDFDFVDEFLDQTKVDNRECFAVRLVEATLWQTLVEWHLAALVAFDGYTGT